MQLGVACAPHKPVPKPSVCSGLGHVWEQSVEDPSAALGEGGREGGSRGTCDSRSLSGGSEILPMVLPFLVKQF